MISFPNWPSVAGAHGDDAFPAPDRLNHVIAMCDDAFPAPDRLNHVDSIDPRTDGAEGAIMDTVAAMNAFFVVNHADAVIGISDCADRAGFLAGTLHVYNSAVGAGFGAQAAGFAFCGINMHPGIAGSDGVKTAGIQAGLPETETADVGHEVFLDRAVVAGGGDHSDYVTGSAVYIRVQPQREADPPPDNLAFLIDTAAVLGLRAWNDRVNQPIEVFRRQPILPGQAADVFENTML